LFFIFGRAEESSIIREIEFIEIVE
jgi:hypothetical protein